MTSAVAPRTVAVIDFDPEVRAQCRNVLEGEGFVVRTGATRADAVALLEREPIDLLIIGLFLADGPAYDVPRREGLAVVGLTDVIQGPTVRKLLKSRYDLLELFDKPLSGANLIDLMRVHFGPRYPRGLGGQSVDDANRAESELHVQTRVRRVGASSVEPAFVPVEAHSGSHRAVDAGILEGLDEVAAELGLDSGDEGVGSEGAGFVRVSTSQTHRPAPSSLVPEGLDWRAVPAEGNLVHVSFAALMARLLHGRYTGSLRLWRQRVRKIVFFNQGRPVSVRSNLLYECLGNLMVRAGYVDEATSAASVARAQAEGRRQGEVLISMGAITEAQLRDALRQQLEERLLDVFGWSEARYHLHDLEAPPEIAAPSREETIALITRGVLERVSLERVIRELEPCLPMHLTVRPDFGASGVSSEEAGVHGRADRADVLGFDTHHQDVIEELRRGGTLLELVARFEQSSQVYQVVYALLVLGFVSLEE